MLRSYDVDFDIVDGRAGFMLYCYENDDCVWEQFFLDSTDAHNMGNRFLDGLYIRGFPLLASA